jgi:nucleotide-binding universal stress UspA family protein
MYDLYQQNHDLPARNFALQKSVFMKKILVPVDFSEASRNAVEVACQLAVRADAGVFLLHVNEMAPYAVPVSEYPYVSSVVDLEEYEKEAYDKIQALKTELLNNPRFAKLDIEATVKEGLVIPVVREQSEDENVDLIVMGTLGASGLKEMLVGSNTERVIRHATCPVLVIPEGTKTLDIKRIVVPSTLKPDQKGVFKTVKAWQELLGFEVHALYVNDPLNAPTHGSVETEKNRLVEAAGLRHVYLHLYGMTLNEEAAIRAYADEAEADLIVMGTHQRRGLSHLVFGSVTEDTVNHAHVPVLAVPI